MLHREELAWAGGLFSGEGCFVREPNTNHPRCFMPQAVSPEVLERFRNAVQIGKVYGPYDRYGKKLVWQYTATGFIRTQAIIAMLWPWLSTAKQEQAKKVLKDYLDIRKGKEKRVTQYKENKD